MTTKQIISAKIVAQIAAGKSLRDAIDAVLGAGTFAAVASEVYDELRVRVGK
jgi:DNA integrity scanning protein DisA with diadenylate cyclase activity